MSRNSGGTCTRVTSTYTAGNDILPTEANADLTDLYADLTDSLSRSGKGAMQANLAMAGFKVTGAANGAASGEYATYDQVILKADIANPTFLNTTSTVTIQSSTNGADAKLTLSAKNLGGTAIQWDFDFDPDNDILVFARSEVPKVYFGADGLGFGRAIQAGVRMVIFGLGATS